MTREVHKYAATDRREMAAMLREVREDLGWTGPLEIDGGIDPDTIRGAAAAGADVFVAGSAVYGSPDGVETAIRTLRERAGG